MKDQLLSTIENSRKYTLQVAEAMPDKDYHFKPAGAGWDFAELLHHIAYGIHWWQDNYITGNKTEWAPPPVKKNRQEVLAYLIKAFASLQKTMKEQTLDEASTYGAHATLDHITHHRAQAVLYLRTHGIEPPEYVY